MGRLSPKPPAFLIPYPVVWALLRLTLQRLCFDLLVFALCCCPLFSPSLAFYLNLTASLAPEGRRRRRRCQGIKTRSHTQVFDCALVFLATFIIARFVVIEAVGEK